MKKTICMILALVMLLSTVAFATGSEAVNGEVDSTPQAVDLESENNSDISLPVDGDISELRRIGAEVLDEEDLFISEEVATYIAQFFISDMVVSQTTKWDDKTHIVNTTVMYDETGNDITAYTFELDKGYIVVAAYVDVPEVIPEWSDEAQPVYEEFNIAQDDKVVYLGALNYYLDDGGANLKTVDNFTVPRGEVNNIFDEVRNINNVQDELLQDIIEKKNDSIENKTGIVLYSGANNNTGGIITDPFTHAKNVYGGAPWVSVEWANNWAGYENFATMTEIWGFQQHCGPVAIINLIKMYGNRYNNSVIKRSSTIDVFGKVIEANYEGTDLYYINAPSNKGGGTYNETANDFIKGSFKKYNVSVSVYGDYVASFKNIKNALGNALGSTNRLIYLMTVGHDAYGNHHVVGYAYTRLHSSSLDAYKTYIKICDGLASGGRYIDMGDTINDTYWEVYFS